MADKEIDDLTAAASITAAVKAHIIQGGNSRRHQGTLGQWILAGSGQTATGIWNQSVDGSKADVDFTGLAGATDIMLICRSVTKAASGSLAFRVSVDNGSTFYSTSGDYVALADVGTEGNSTAMGVFHATDASAARSGVAAIYGANVSGAPKTGENITVGTFARLFVASTSPINAVRVYSTGGGNLTGGAIYCFARF